MAILVNIGRGIQKSMRGTTGFFRGSLLELKKVRWPTQKEMLNYTLVVIITVSLVCLFLFAIDYLIAQLVKWITGA